MPRWYRDPAADAASNNARHRLTASLARFAENDPLILPSESSDAPAAADGESRTRASQVRWRSPWRVAALMAVAGIVVLGWMAWRWMGEQPTVEPLAQASATADTGPASEHPAPQAAGTAKLVVHVSGAVPKPGVVELPGGSRVFEAIAAAGGSLPSADVQALNLAAPVQDGSKIHVPAAGELPPGPTAGGGSPASSGSTGGSSGSGEKVNLNSATAEELGGLPRVGPVVAQRIVDWRREHGPFTSVDELDAVEGIGPKMMESLRPLVVV